MSYADVVLNLLSHQMKAHIREEEKKKYHILPGTCREVSLKYVRFSEGQFCVRRAKEGEPVSRNKIIDDMHKS